MSFSKVGPPGGWAVGASLTSAQLNQLDTDHANALDKTIAGDTLSGVIAMTSTASITVQWAGNIVSSVASGIKATGAGGITSTTGGGITTSVANGIAPNIAAGITNGGFAGGIAANSANGITDGGQAHGIAATVAAGIYDGGVAGGIAATVAAGIKSTTAGGFQLAGGSSDYPGFSASRNLVRSKIIRPVAALNTGWTGVRQLTGPGTNAAQWCVLDPLIEGATLTQVVITFAVTNAHSGGVPAQLPLFSVQAFSISNSAAYNNPVTLNSGDVGTGLGPSSPGSGAAWYNSGNNQFFLYSCNQNNTINTGLYNYAVLITDENGANSASGNWYLAFTMTYSVSQLAYA